VTGDDFVIEDFLDRLLIAIEIDDFGSRKTDVGLGDVMAALVIGREILGAIADVVMHLAIVALLMKDKTVRGLQEAVLVDLRVGRKVVDKPMF
jgi:hypothetical protein